MFSDVSFKKEIIILIVCFILLISINYNFLDSELDNFLINSESKFIKVSRVIDGDTITYNNENNSEVSVRLLGINTPEKGEKFYSEAKEFMENKVLNKSVKLVYENEKTDRYGRELAYIFLEGENINKKIIEEGYGNYYFPSGKTSYYKDFLNSWKDCIDNELRLCKKSRKKCAECIELKEINEFEQETVFYNSCNFSCNLTDWIIKDEGRKKFIFQDFVLGPDNKVSVKVGDKKDTENKLYWKGEVYVWTSSGDTLFLRDSEGRLVLWKVVS